MLVLTRKKDESILVGEHVEVKVLEIRGNRVRLGVVAPEDTKVHRKEVWLKIAGQKKAA